MCIRDGDAHWYQAQRRDDSTRAAIDACGGGVPGAYFRVAGRTFDRQDPLGRLSYANSQHLATLGALTDYDRHKEDAERRLPWERLEGRYSWREAHVTRVAPTQHRWFLEQLVVVRDEERTRLGVVSRISLGPDGELDVTMKLWPGSPKNICAPTMPMPCVRAWASEPVCPNSVPSPGATIPNSCKTTLKWPCSMRRRESLASVTEFRR